MRRTLSAWQHKCRCCLLVPLQTSHLNISPARHLRGPSKNTPASSSVLPSAVCATMGGQAMPGGDHMARQSALGTLHPCLSFSYVPMDYNTSIACFFRLPAFCFCMGFCNSRKNRLQQTAMHASSSCRSPWSPRTIRENRATDT